MSEKVEVKEVVDSETGAVEMRFCFGDRSFKSFEDLEKWVKELNAAIVTFKNSAGDSTIT